MLWLPDDGRIFPSFLLLYKKVFLLNFSSTKTQHGENVWWAEQCYCLTQHMHTGLKSEFSQQSLISKCLLNSVIL